MLKFMVIDFDAWKEKVASNRKSHWPVSSFKSNSNIFRDNIIFQWTHLLNILIYRTFNE